MAFLDRTARSMLLGELVAGLGLIMLGVAIVQFSRAE